METRKRLHLPVIATILIVINLFVWLVLEAGGDTTDGYYMLKCGAAYAPWIFEDGMWWRLFTCTFLHFGAEHLVSNMLMLFVLGTILERALGKVRFSVVYILSGLSGSLLSCGIEYKTGEYAISAGASGAVYGIVGGLIALAIWNKGKVEDLTMKELFIMLGICLVYGFTEPDVDVWGHMGGLIGGIVLGSIFALLKKIDFMVKSKYTID